MFYKLRAPSALYTYRLATHRNPKPHRISADGKIVPVGLSPCSMHNVIRPCGARCVPTLFNTNNALYIYERRKSHIKHLCQSAFAGFGFAL